MSGYHELMQEAYLAHRDFKDKWKKWDHFDKKLKVEPKAVTDARNKFFQKLDSLYVTKISPLELKFKENPHSVIDELTEFLLVDITAHRCGYAKEFFLKWLKQANFSVIEIKKIQTIIIEVCETKSFRREFRRWGRLAAKIADADFVDDLQNLTQSENHFARLKSRWILEMIRQNRLDLRSKLNEN